LRKIVELGQYAAQISKAIALKRLPGGPLGCKKSYCIRRVYHKKHVNVYN